MTRLISGVILAAAVLAAIVFLPPLLLRALACGVAILAAREFLRVAQVASPLPVLALVAATCWLVPDWRGDLVVRLLALAAAWVALTVLWKDTPVKDASTQVFAALYLGLPLGMLVAIHAEAGPRIALLVIGSIVVSDSAQYYTGRLLGRRPLAPAISPKKTQEGALGGVVFGTLFVVLAGRMLLPGASLPGLLLIGVLLVAAGICGDLFESRLKRASGVKDSAAVIPGHGGVLDRIDALLFAAPVFYFYLQTGRP